jgi:hypothetical protein
MCLGALYIVLCSLCVARLDEQGLLQLCADLLSKQGVAWGGIYGAACATACALGTATPLLMCASVLV